MASGQMARTLEYPWPSRKLAYLARWRSKQPAQPRRTYVPSTGPASATPPGGLQLGGAAPQGQRAAVAAHHERLGRVLLARWHVENEAQLLALRVDVEAVARLGQEGALVSLSPCPGNKTLTSIKAASNRPLSIASQEAIER